MTSYISISFSRRDQFSRELETIKQVLLASNITPFVFVDQYLFDQAQEHLMMEQAMKDIDACSLFIAETSHKAIGIGVEAGYAKAKGKPVVYCRKSTTEHSTTVSGISDVQIIYQNADDLENQLRDAIAQILF